MEAAQRGHTQTVKALLDLGGNPLGTDVDGWTALHFAARLGHQQCVAALMPVTPPTPAHLEAYTPVHAASFKGHVEVLKQLAGAGWPLTARDSYGNTPMHRAAAGGNLTCLQWLMQQGGDPSVQNNAGHTPLDEELVTAVREGDEAGVRSALNRGARPEVIVPTNDGASWNLLSLAASKGHHHLLPRLLEAGLSIEGGGTTDRTPLMEAAECGHTQTVKALLKLGGNPLSMNSIGWTALHFAARQGHHHCVAALIPVTPPPPAHLEAYTPVHAASYKGHVEVLKQVAGAGWPLTARDSDGDTPMHHAASGGCVAAVKWLVQRGGDPHVQSKDGHTPLELAVQYGRHEVETWLVKNGGSVVRSKILRVEGVRAWRDVHENQHNSVLSMLVVGNEAAMASIPEDDDGHALSQDGLTPLHAAALCGAPSDAVEALLRRGVSPHVTTPDNMTPADLAQQQGHDSVIKGLQCHHCEQSGAPPEHLHEKLLSTVSRQDDVQAVSTLLCKGAPIELLGGHSVLKLAVTTDRTHTVSLLLASGAPLSASLLQEAWQSPDVTHRVLAFLTTAYCCRLRAEQRRLEKVSSALVEGIDNLVKTIEGNTPWQAAWRWGKETDRPALSDLLAKAAAANCPVTAAFLHRAGGWTVFNEASGGTALHAALEAGHRGMAELLIRDLGACPYVPDTHGRLPVHMMPNEEQQRLEQKLFMAEREKLENMELRLKADHEKTAARTALYIQEDLFESHKKGESKNIFSPDGRAAMLLASRKGLLQLTHFILQEGQFLVDEVLDDTCGTTALHQAASHGQDGCVALLLSAGANTQQCDTYGQTPRHLAAMFGHKSTFELLTHQQTQDPPCRAGTTATQVKENFKVFHNMYYKYKRNLLNTVDRHNPESVIRNLMKSISLQELQKEAQRMAVDLSKGEAFEVKEAVMAEISIILNKVSVADPTYRGDLRLVGSSRDGSKLYAPDEFDINLVIHEDNVRINVSKRGKEEAPLKGSLQISVKTDNPHLKGNRFMASLYEEVHRCLSGHTLQDERLSLVPPGLTSTQVGVGLSLAWQGRECPLLLVSVDLVPVLEVPWLEQVSRPFLTPENTTTMQLSNAADGTWRCSFALTEAKVLRMLTPAERQVQLMGKVLLSRLKPERWMPRHKKSFFKWFATREWNIAVPNGFCFKNALLRWLEHRRWREVELGAGQEQDHIKELGVGQEGDHTKKLGAGQEGDHAKELGAGQEGDRTKELGAGQDGDHAKELGAGQEGDNTKELGAGQEGDHAKELGDGQKGDRPKELGVGQEGDHTKELGTEQKGDHSKKLEVEQEGDHTKELGAGQERDHAKELGPGRKGDPARWLVEVFRLMCANPEESREHLTTQNSSAYFGGDCEGRKPGDGAPTIVQCLEEGLEKLCFGSASAKTTRPRRRKY
ncbi:ankyrin-2-like isoform X2 [Scylla paramamosain]